MHFVPRESKEATVAMDLMDWDEALRQLEEHLQRVQEQMKKFVDNKGKDVFFGRRGCFPQAEAP